MITTQELIKVVKESNGKMIEASLILGSFSATHFLYLKGN